MQYMSKYFSRTNSQKKRARRPLSSRMVETVFYFLLAYSPVYRFSSTSLSTIHVDYLVIVSATSNIQSLSNVSSIPSMSSFLEQYFYCVLQPSSIAVSSALCFSC